MTSISIIQVCRDKNKIAQSNLEELSGVEQVIVTETLSPSTARNKAILKVQHPVILFLDDDCIIDQKTIDLYLKHFSNESLDVIGGPALIRTSKNKTKLHALLCSSFFLFGPSYSRYHPKGVMRETSEKELILCNLAFRTTLFDKYAPFQEGLYPGEENEILRRLSKNAVKLYYDPRLLVTRTMTASSQLLIVKIFRYAYHRACFGKLSDFYYYIPIIFVAVALTAPFIKLCSALMMIYGVAVITESLRLIVKHQQIQLLLLSVVLIPMLHLAYGFGLILGLLLFCAHSFSHFLNTRHRVDVFK
jgi:succinoglycan biosynthesis protein ExoA